jgi:hypothetical protein
MAIPALTDTYGSIAFMKASTNIKINEDPLLKKINSVRQDSGLVTEFLRLMEDNDCDLPVMASEIDSVDTLTEVMQLKKSNGQYAYASIGAGGFFGDSNNKETSTSMAVKATRIYLNSTLLGYPVKLADGSGKLSIDPNNSLDVYSKVSERSYCMKKKWVVPQS